MKFSDELQESVADQWNRVVNHRFTEELAAGTIDRSVLVKYLVQDHRFLDSFVVLLSSIVAHARSLQDRIPGCQFLALVTGAENTYFERSFQKLGISVQNRLEIPDAPCTTAFCNLMRETANSGHLGEMLAVIVVCEWSYMSWGERVKDKTVRKDFEMYEWVDLHSGKYFQSVIAYLRGLLDKEGELLDEVGRERCTTRFRQAVQLEEDFFEFAYLP
jgi:thiaminase (transcriptional activator TenA)